MESDAQNDIASLRLVNKNLHRLTTPILFKYVNAHFFTGCLVSPHVWTARLLEFSQSPLVEAVQYLSVAFESHSLIDGVQGGLFEVAFALPPLVHACKKLKGLEIYGSVAEHGKDHQFDPNLFVKTVEHIFRRVSPNTQYCTLQSLALTLPLTCDFAMLAKISTEHSPMPYRRPLLHILKDLKHLHLEVTDNSGEAGQRHSSSLESRRHRMYPNTLHAIDFFHFATIPDGLHSLSITATHILDMDVLDTSNLQGLQTLYLSRVKLSSETLTSISSRNASSLKSIELNELELKSGTWESVLTEFCSLSRLECFWIDLCGYAKDGTSAHLSSGLSSPNDDLEEIESLNYGDIAALGFLQKHVNGVRIWAGDEPYTDRDYRFAVDPSSDESNTSIESSP